MEPKNLRPLYRTNGRTETPLKKGMGIASELREEGCFVEYDLIGKGLNAQMKYANKIGAKFVMVLGDNEIESGVAKLKNMATGEQTDIRLDNTIAENFSNATYGGYVQGYRLLIIEEIYRKGELSNEM